MGRPVTKLAAPVSKRVAVELRSPVKLGGRRREIGEALEVDESVAATLVAAGDAVALEPQASASPLLAHDGQPPLV